MVKIERPFKAFVKAIPSALKNHKFNTVGVAYANCAAKSLGKTIPGNQENLFFASRYAVRMLAVSTAAGMEVPIRIYVTDTAKGMAKVTYRLSSYAFSAYDVEDLTSMGKELDGMRTTILDTAVAGTK